MGTYTSFGRPAIGLLAALSGCDASLFVEAGFLDADRDTLPIGADCDDTDPDLGELRTWYRDDDGDGYGVNEEIFDACVRPDGYAAERGDCDDEDDQIWPGQADSCDGIDNNCNEVVDDPVFSVGGAEVSLASHFSDERGHWDGEIDEDGDVLFCPGRHPTNLIITGASVTLRPHLEGREVVPILDGELSGSVLHVRDGSSVVVEELALVGGEAENGGGIHVSDSALQLVRSELTGNHATRGGGLYLSQSSVGVEDTRIHENKADRDGGGLYAQGGLGVELASGVSIHENIAGDRGGGIYATGGLAVGAEQDAVVSVYLNEAERGGGIFFEAADGDLLIDGVELSENTADEGGGLYQSHTEGGSGVVEVGARAVLEGNSANSGAGFFCESEVTAEATFTNATVASNVVWSGGAGGARLGALCHLRSESQSRWVLNAPDTISTLDAASIETAYDAGSLDALGPDFQCYAGCCASCPEGGCALEDLPTEGCPDQAASNP